MTNSIANQAEPQHENIAAQTDGGDDGTRTRDLERDKLAFYPTELRPHFQGAEFSGGRCRARTCDPHGVNVMLYQLS